MLWEFLFYRVRDQSFIGSCNVSRPQREWWSQWSDSDRLTRKLQKASWIPTREAGDTCETCRSRRNLRPTLLPGSSSGSSKYWRLHSYSFRKFSICCVFLLRTLKWLLQKRDNQGQEHDPNVWVAWVRVRGGEEPTSACPRLVSPPPGPPRTGPAGPRDPASNACGEIKWEKDSLQSLVESIIAYEEFKDSVLTLWIHRF